MPQSFPFKLGKANLKAPFNPYASGAHPLRGNPNDSASYLSNPGTNFYRPWLASNDKYNGAAFIWPLGIEGFELTIDPTLGIHKMIGDNTVEVDITHLGEEHFTLSGNFPGDTGPDNLRALRQLVYMVTPKTGKVLYVPYILSYAQRVVVVRATFNHGAEDRGKDLNYSIEFVRIGLVSTLRSDNQPRLSSVPPAAPSGTQSKAGKRSVKVDGKHNTLRKIANWKLGSSNKWESIYKLNQSWFTKRGIITAKIPDHRLPLGTVIYY